MRRLVLPNKRELSRIHVARREISTPMGLQICRIEVQIGLQLMMIRRISLARKPAAATKSPPKKPPVKTAKAKTPAPVVTLKHIAAEIAEAHELHKTHADSMSKPEGHLPHQQGIERGGLVGWWVARL